MFNNFSLFWDYQGLEKRNVLIKHNISIEETKKNNIIEEIKFLNTDIGYQGAALEHNIVKRPGEKVVEIIDF